jgi:hypothetical protein
MPNNYRVYRLDRANHVLDVEWMTAASDEQAVAAARALKRADKCEIWQGERLVATIESEAAQRPSSAIWL